MKKGMNMKWLGEDPFFKNHFPFKDFKEHMDLDPADVDKYVEDAITKALGDNRIPDFGHAGRTKLSHEIIDTHHFVIAKIKIPRRVHPENVWVQVSRTQLRINGVEEGEPQHIALPAPVNPTGAKATFKLGSLQIKIPKMNSGRFQEVPVRYL